MEKIKKVDGLMIVDFWENEYDIQTTEIEFDSDIDAEIENCLDEILQDENYKVKYLNKSVCFMFNFISEESYCYDSGVEYDCYIDIVEEYIISNDITKKYDVDCENSTYIDMFAE
jgi:hypothetical protein